MRKRSWNYYLGLAAGVHGLLIALLAFAGLGWLSGEPEEKPAIEVGFVAETAVASMAGGSEAGGEAPKTGPAIKTASVAAVEKLQSLRGHSAEAASKPAVSAADRENAVEEAAAAIDAASTGAEVDGKGSAGVGANGGSTDGDNGSGSAEGTGGSGTGTSQGLGAGFTPNGDGTYTAASAAGIDYQLLRDANAVYPEEARSIGYSNVVEVVARIMVGLDGSVESVTILNSPPKLGFREAAQEALWSMRFAPIYYQGVNIRVPFEKHVIFQP